MKHILGLILLLGIFSCTAQKKTVKLEMKQTHPYCGGARPTPEIEEKARVPHPYADKTLIYVSAKGGKSQTVKTNAEGLLTVKLSPGTYFFYEPWKYYKKTPDGSAIDNYDKACLEEVWKKEDLKITYTKVKLDEKLDIQNNIESAKCPWNLDCLVKKHMPE